MRKIILPFLTVLGFLSFKTPVKNIVFSSFGIAMTDACFGQYTTSGATTADSSWIVYTTRPGTLPVNSSKGLLVRDTSWMRFKTRVIIVDSLSANRSVEVPTTIMWLKKGAGCDTMEVSLIDSLHISGNSITSLAFTKITGVPAFLTAETDPLSAHIADTATMLFPYLRKVNAVSGTVTSIGLTSTDFSLSGSPVTSSGNITANLVTSGVSAATYNGSYTVNNKGIVTAANNASLNNSASHSIVTVAAAANGFQISSTKISTVYYSIRIVSAVQIGVVTNVEGYVVLEIAATNSTTAGDWTEIGRASTGQNIALALALSSSLSVGSQIAGVVPIGYYARLRSVNVAGTPTYSYISGQEVSY